MKKNKRLLVLALVLAVLAAVLYSALAGAVWNPDEAVQFTEAQYNDVEPSTFLIGTHLVHLSALTEQLYGVAQDSAEASAQETIYYKSELADGTWFDITTASTLVDITTGGTPVDMATLTARYLTHQTGSDGVTIDLRTNEAVNIYDIVDPYDLEGLDELLPLKNQYDLIREQQKDSAAGKEKMARIEQIFATELHNEVTDEADRGIASLQTYYDVLSDNDGGASEMDAVQKVMDALDATRRAEVFAIVEPILNAYCIELTSMADVSDDEGETTAAEGSDNSLQEAANESYQNVSNSLIEQQGKMLAEGTTIAGKVEYEISMQLVADANSNDHTACDADVAQLLALDNIAASTVGNRASEMALLDDKLLPQATNAYLDGLSAGATAEYRQSAAGNAAGALLRSIMDAGVSEVNAVRTELESFIDARCLRLSNADATAFIDERLEQATGYYNRVANDAFLDALNKTVASHIEFLSNKKRELELAAGGNEIDKAAAEKSALQSQLLSALDKNDLATASVLEDQIAALDEKVAALEKEQTAKLNDLQNQKNDLENQLKDDSLSDAEKDRLNSALNELNTEIAGAMASMSDGTLGELIAELRADALDLIDEGSGSAQTRNDLQDKIDSLGELLDGNSAAVFPALKDIHQALAAARDLDGDDGFGDQIDAVEELILNNADAFSAAMQGDKTAAELQAIADAFFSESDLLNAGANGLGGSGQDGSGQGGSGQGGAALDLTDLNSDEQAAIYMAALNEYIDATGSANADGLLGGLLQTQYGLGNPFVFLDLSDREMEYVPVTALARLTGMRHVWNKNYRCATLARGVRFYNFTVYSDAVTTGREADQVAYMDAPVKYQNAAYVPETYTQEQFEASAQPIAGSGLAILLADKWSDAVQELFARFLA